MTSFRTRVLAVVAAAAALAFFANATVATPPQAGKGQATQIQKGTKITGHIVNIKGTDQVIVRTNDNRDVLLHINPQTRFLLNNKAVVFTDLREGVPVFVFYDATGAQFLAGEFTLTPTEFVEGEVVRVVEPERQLVVRTTAGKEMTFLTEDQTSFTFDNRAVKLVDFRPGANVRVHFDMRDGKQMAHSVWTMPKK